MKKKIIKVNNFLSEILEYMENDVTGTIHILDSDYYFHLDKGRIVNFESWSENNLVTFLLECKILETEIVRNIKIQQLESFRSFLSFLVKDFSVDKDNITKLYQVYFHIAIYQLISKPQKIVFTEQSTEIDNNFVNLVRPDSIISTVGKIVDEIPDLFKYTALLKYEIVVNDKNSDFKNTTLIKNYLHKSQPFNDFMFDVKEAVDFHQISLVRDIKRHSLFYRTASIILFATIFGFTIAKGIKKRSFKQNIIQKIETQQAEFEHKNKKLEETFLSFD